MATTFYTAVMNRLGVQPSPLLANSPNIKSHGRSLHIHDYSDYSSQDLGIDASLPNEESGYVMSTHFGTMGFDRSRCVSYLTGIAYAIEKSGLIRPLSIPLDQNFFSFVSESGSSPRVLLHDVNMPVCLSIESGRIYFGARLRERDFEIGSIPIHRNPCFTRDNRVAIEMSMDFSQFVYSALEVINISPFAFLNYPFGNGYSSSARDVYKLEDCLSKWSKDHAIFFLTTSQCPDVSLIPIWDSFVDGGALAVIYIREAGYFSHRVAILGRNDEFDLSLITYGEMMSGQLINRNPRGFIRGALKVDGDGNMVLRENFVDADSRIWSQIANIYIGGRRRFILNEWQRDESSGRSDHREHMVVVQSLSEIHGLPGSMGEAVNGWEKELFEGDWELKR